MIRRVHLARDPLGLTACGLVARDRNHRARWTLPPPTPRCWRCTACRRVLRAGDTRRRRHKKEDAFGEGILIQSQENTR